MKTKDFYSMLKKLGIPVAYSVFKSEVELPYCVYEESREVRGGDFKNYIAEAEYRVELYCDERNVELEERLEKLLDENGFEYSAEYAIYISSEQMFMTVYEVEPIAFKK